jgi:uncharacterized integral membrane protein
MPDRPDPSYADEAGYYPSEPVPMERAAERPRGLVVAFVVGALAAAGLVTFGFQNTQSVPVHFLWFDGEAPLWVVMAITAVGAVLLAKLIGLVVRSRRRRRRTPAD